MNKTMICIACPRGCLLTVTGRDDNIEVSGHQCPRGIDYGRQEILQPMRMLTTTVRTMDPDSPRIPVRLSTEVSKARIFDCMSEINRFILNRTVKPGDVLIGNVCETGAALIATGGFDNEG